MSGSVETPSATEDATALADYLELLALLDTDKNSSIQDLVHDLRRSGTANAEPVDDEDAADKAGRFDRGSEQSQAYAEGAFAEIEDRYEACGGDGGRYPFAVSERAIQGEHGTIRSLYVFMLLLGRFGKDAGPAGSHPERLFEDVCANAAEGYLRGEDGKSASLVFGFPRRVLPPGFSSALDAMCNATGEGRPNKRAPEASNQKDARLDVVAWRGFPDRRRGQLICWGQCATGHSEWKKKAGELDPQRFQQAWLEEWLLVHPVRAFFVPWRVAEEDWRLTCIDGGVLFDRCRIAYHAHTVAEEVANACSTWSVNVLKAVAG